VQLVSTLGSVVISARAELGSIITSALPHCFTGVVCVPSQRELGSIITSALPHCFTGVVCVPSQRELGSIITSALPHCFTGVGGVVCVPSQPSACASAPSSCASDSALRGGMRFCSVFSPWLLHTSHSPSGSFFS
jgi:hypothetical protein